MDETLEGKQEANGLRGDGGLKAAPLIEEAAEYAHREFTLADVLQNICEGKQQLWVVSEHEEIKFVWVTQIIKQTERTICLVFAAAGEMKYGWDFWPWMSQWMIGNNIDEAEVYCRPSMARLLRSHGLKTMFEVLSIKPEGVQL